MENQFLMLVNDTRKNIVWDFIALLAGATLILAFAPYQIFPLAIIVPAILALLWFKTTRLRAFWRGFLFGLGLFGCGVYWVYISMHRFADVPMPLAVFLTFGFVAILSLFPAFTGYIINRFFPVPNAAKLILAMPCVWVVMEWLRSWLFTGFPWLYIGYTQIYSPLSGYAAIFSVYGVSFATVLSGTLLLTAWFDYQQKSYKNMYLKLLALTLLWLLGFALTLIPWTKPFGRPLTVSIVQGSIPQQLKWDPDNVELSFSRYQDLSENLWGKSQLIIWPEAALPVPLQEIESFIQGLNEKAIKSGSELILGIPIAAATKNDYYNAIITLGKNNEAYLKRHLVPFGEYTPFSKLLSPVLSFMKIPMSTMLAGRPNQQPLLINGVKVSAFICYEIAFPELVLNKDRDLGIILSVVNDAWFGESNAQAEQLQIAQMRALELGRPVLVASNDGISAIISAKGTIDKTIPPYQAGVLTGTVQPMQGLTPWQRFKLDPLIFIILISIVYAKRKQYV
jgi:apolipoprotein N-acyltransferase